MQRRYAFITEQKKAYPLKLLCDVLAVSRSGYYKYRQRKLSEKAVQEVLLLEEVKQLAQESDNSYGSRSISKRLQAKGYALGRYAAKTLMRKAGVVCKQRRRYRVTIRSHGDGRAADNVLNRLFKVSAPNRCWVADITFLWTLEGWLYIAAILDLFSRRVVGWAMAEHMKTSLVADALQMALTRRQPRQGLLHHSDRGVQYMSDAYQALLKAAGITVSISRKGNCWDNAVMERFWGSLKAERTNGRVYPTRLMAKIDVIDYIEMFYNCKRPHATLGYLSPMQFETQSLLKNLSTFT